MINLNNFFNYYDIMMSSTIMLSKSGNEGMLKLRLVVSWKIKKTICQKLKQKIHTFIKD